MNSSLVTYEHITNKSNARENKISKITIHHYAGIVSTKRGTDYLSETSRDVSANYVIGDEGGVGLNVPENRRAWTSSSSWNDHRAVTIEVSNSTLDPTFEISKEAMSTLIKLVADICKRNGIDKLWYDGTTNGTLTLHEMFTPTNCPGPYIKKNLGYIQDEVNKLLGHTETTPNKPTTPSGLDPKWVGLSIDTVARQVIIGDWYTGQARVDSLTRYGYDYQTVQNRVNEILYGKPTVQTPKPNKKTVAQLADEVNQGLWGNGNDRKNRLTSAGYDYSAVQNEINRRLGLGSVKPQPQTQRMTNAQVAYQIVYGNNKWGNGNARKVNLEKEGYNYNAVQAEVNKLV